MIMQLSLFPEKPLPEKPFNTWSVKDVKGLKWGIVSILDNQGKVIQRQVVYSCLLK
ncbi:hypothetical protein GU926_08285 [Nibribacter ruber]|uniref:Uncharacterized protein n=1 Tax=Nibribacter ruber TaxID=2698458 RepID=A0A6P1NYG6_9BACT|nr:hypothetical protein [Nibribacter ruber]QHL87434.1 hypothetical protein GU926_08285 [Nibribacter ruber]